MNIRNAFLPPWTHATSDTFLALNLQVENKSSASFLPALNRLFHGILEASTVRSMSIVRSTE